MILRLSQLQLIDATGAHTVTELVTAVGQRDVTVLIKGTRPEHLFAELAPAIEHARSHIRRAAAATTA